MNYNQIMMANASAVGFSFLEIKELLQLVVLALSIILTIIQLIKKKNNV